MEHILVVDDDVAIRRALTLILRREGYAVATASNGEEALAQIDDHRPSLLILDLMMPVMDGWEVSRRLQETGTREIPVIVLTAADNPEQAAAGVGAAEVIPKPFAVDELLTAVRQYRRPAHA